MSGNGQAHIEALASAPLRRKVAELSSQERSALVDELVAVVNGNARALKELRDRVEALERATAAVRQSTAEQATTHRAFVEQSRLERWRWLVM